MSNGVFCCRMHSKTHGSVFKIIGLASKNLCQCYRSRPGHSTDVSCYTHYSPIYSQPEPEPQPVSFSVSVLEAIAINKIYLILSSIKIKTI